jgi:hypothetical protein
MSAGARVAIFVALLTAIFVVAALAGRALHPGSAADGGGKRATAATAAAGDAGEHAGRGAHPGKRAVRGAAALCAPVAP